jgi:hypothetical protein
MSVWGDIASGIGDFLGSDTARELAVNVGTAIYQHNNPVENRSLPPVQWAPRLPANYYGSQPILGVPQGYADDDSRFENLMEYIVPGARADDLLDQAVGGINQLIGGSSMVNGNGAMIPHAQHQPLFRARRSGAVGQRVIPVINPISGKTHFFGDLGQPLLFSRDFSAHKRVNRLARKAARKR